ncbi:hypothetical protein [Desertimonas flava]|uniref:hypothetical protein n=1 Tax=Desertimonas flava TaxID=2064846 RepID=UPI0013C43D47|nr:hypothetical protein [Desertimonas flava]
MIAWPSWSAYSDNGRNGNDARIVYSLDGEQLFPYMGAWANGCVVTAVFDYVLVIEWQRGTNDWRSTYLAPGESHTISLIEPEDNALIETPDSPTTFGIRLENCDPQPLGSS